MKSPKQNCLHLQTWSSQLFFNPSPSHCCLEAADSVVKSSRTIIIKKVERRQGGGTFCQRMEWMDPTKQPNNWTNSKPHASQVNSSADGKSFMVKWYFNAYIILIVGEVNKWAGWRSIEKICLEFVDVYCATIYNKMSKSILKEKYVKWHLWKDCMNKMTLLKILYT